MGSLSVEDQAKIHTYVDASAIVNGLELNGFMSSEEAQSVADGVA